MGKKYGNFMGKFLELLGEGTGFFKWPPEGSDEWIYREIRRSKKHYHKYYNAVGHLKRRGLVTTVSKDGTKFLQLTSKGQLELLLSKAVMKEKPTSWDKRWRLVIFDIPEDQRKKRNLLRRLLKMNGFIKLQASVFISPNPLNREGIAYLKQSGLIGYIRIMRIDDIDSDKDLKKKFKL